MSSSTCTGTAGNGKTLNENVINYNAGRGGQKKKETPEMNTQAKRARTSEPSFRKKEAEKEEKVPYSIVRAV
jgi:hypothetical protein